MNAPHHSLFVLTRDFTSDPTAQYLLRRALGARRRGRVVTVVLRGIAAERATADEQSAPPLLSRLCASGAQILLAEGVAPPGGNVSYGTIGDAALTDLLLSPDVEALWC